ncbi:MAG TPA: NAD-dependent epimerase/dehydratase family protein [Rhizomicrobium sp.]|jgi:nucleoside-diphosphate-sugar epimerase|nr:NAD-dependent epimerase/dehydratase family protein [Rhizomicrobium sp.]
MSDLVLVTGGAGFIGSHLSARLIKRGYRVRVLDNLSMGRRDWVPEGAEFVEGDIRDLPTCHSACEGVRGVFHTAAMSRVGPSQEAVDICTQQNVVGTQNMLLAARDVKVKKFIYSGSSTYYGNQDVPHREDMRGEFLNFYALSKYAGEEYCRMFDRVFGTPVVILRYFNVYGPHQPQTGPYALVLGIFLKRWRDGQTLEVHGTGAQRRDFVHVRDVADVNIAAYESPLHDNTFNVGSGSNISIKELADQISSDQVPGPARAGDSKETLADISHTASALNWRPSVTLQDGLAELKYLTRQGLE